MKRSGIVLAAACALLLCAMALKGLLVELPALPRVAPAHAFDANRAAAHLAFILGDQRPHPVDSNANDAVRERLVEQLRSLGLQPQVTDDIACSSSKSAPSISCARVRNVLATMGPGTGKHLMLVSHYDSSPAGPGASDDGIGMATMLETAAELRRRPLARPVTFLFTDGEEAGLLGARAFLQRNPLAAQVDTILNFEARGVTGPALMFETDTPNGAALRHYEAAVDRPAANSLTADFAKLIPNSTDVEVFKARRGWTILNFAVIGNETRYHTPGDTLEALDRRSLQHMGDQALALATRLASGASVEAGGERIYADVLGQGLVSMPLLVGLVILGLLMALFLYLGWRRRAGLGRGVLAVLLALLCAPALTFLGQKAVGLAKAGEYWRGYPEITGIAVYVSALVAGILAVAFLGRRVGPDRLRAAYWLVFLMIGAGLCFVAPGASIFFLLPPLVTGIGMLLERRLPGAERVGALAAALLLFLSWAPLLHLTEALLDFDAAWTFAPIAAIILLPALVELDTLVKDAARHTLLLGCAAIFVAAWAATGLVPAYTPDRKQAFGIEYLWDENARKAWWLIAHDGAALPPAFERIGSFRPGFAVDHSTRRRWSAPAPTGRDEAARVEKLGERRAGSGRAIMLKLNPAGANAIRLRAAPQAGLAAVRVGGAEYRFGKGKESRATFRCQGRSCDGMTVELLIGHARPIDLTVSGTRYSLPQAAAPLMTARPANAAPQYSPDLSISVSRARI